MKSLHVALIVKNTPSSYEREGKNVGYFSYPVPEFTWDYLSPGKGARVDTKSLRQQGYDLIFHVDGGNWIDYGGRAIPVVYYTIDSTLSKDYHFAPRFEQARRVDLVLVDHDDLALFEATGNPVRRWNYCVNDNVFFPREKSIDVDFQCGGSPERAVTRVRLSDLCKDNGFSYRSGVSGLPEYADTMGRSKVVVVQPRVPQNRPHRLLDALASGAMVFSYRFPHTIGDHLEPYTNYLELSNELPGASLAQIADMLRDGSWEAMSKVGHQTVMKYHTWAIRAAELRALLAKELAL